MIDPDFTFRQYVCPGFAFGFCAIEFKGVITDGKIFAVSGRSVAGFGSCADIKSGAIRTAAENLRISMVHIIIDMRAQSQTYKTHR